MPEGHSFAREGEAAVEGTSETRSHAIGQYRIRGPCYGEAGVARSAFIAASAAGRFAQHIRQLRNCCGSGVTGARSCVQQNAVGFYRCLSISSA